jgi:AraC-like DNA-binding protein
MTEGGIYRLERCPQGRWELAQMRPPADLAGDVVRYAGYLEHGGWSIDNREVASPIVPLIINLGDPFRVRMGANGAEDRGSFVAGLYDGYADVTSLGRAHCMQVDLTPLGAYRFFAVPMRDLAARTVPLEEVGASDELPCRLYEAPDWGARFVLLDRFVRRRLAAARAPSPPVAWAWRQLAATGGRVRVSALAGEIGWSRKHLARRFALEIGAGPKTVGRIWRFAGTRHAIDAGTSSGCLDWAGLAADWGYADQAHLIREFRAMAGATPADYARDAAGRFRAVSERRVTNLQYRRRGTG